MKEKEHKVKIRKKWLDANAQSGDDSNRATISYEKVENNSPSICDWQSVDGETQDPYTTFHATWAERHDTVQSVASSAPTHYSSDQEVLVTLKVKNPNSITITDMFLNIDWDASFSFENGSYTCTSTTALRRGYYF